VRRTLVLIINTLTKVLLTQPYVTLNNVFIIKTKVLLTQPYVTLDNVFIIKTRVLLTSKVTYGCVRRTLVLIINTLFKVTYG
jgi:hypothetical protein